MSKYGEPWKAGDRSVNSLPPYKILKANGEPIAEFQSGLLCNQAIVSVNALAGLEASDVATLVGLVRGHVQIHDWDMQAKGMPGLDQCVCWFCRAARPLIVRLPE